MDCIEIIKRLRNTIHTQAMHIIKVGEPRAAESFVALPTDQTEQLKAAMSGLGLEAWGAKEFTPSRMYANFVLLTRQMIISGTAALDEMIGALPLDEPEEPEKVPTSTWEAVLRSEHVRRQMMWQFGL